MTASSGAYVASSRLTEVRCPGPLDLFCDDCGTTFITYNPNAERGHRLQVGAVLDDSTRHARECPSRPQESTSGDPDA